MGTRKTHGLSRTHSEYSTWGAIRYRCLNPNCRQYPDYGGRGITICDEWRDTPAGFLRYLDEVLGPRPPGYTLDRIDNDDGYRPGNLRWATWSEQKLNQRPDKRPPRRLSWGASSGRRGVYPHKGRWQVQFDHRTLGYFDALDSAARAYDEAAYAALGERAILNFPEECRRGA